MSAAISLTLMTLLYQGVTFTKPSLGQFSLHGSTDNNIIGDMFLEGKTSGYNRTSFNSVFIDAKEPMGSSKRFRAFSSNVVYISADGKKWQIEGDLNVPVGPCSINHFDTEDVMLFDPKCECYSFCKQRLKTAKEACSEV